LIEHIGEFAALASSFLIATTSTLFTLSGRKVGSVVVNRTRLILAIILLSVAHLVLKIPFPFHISIERGGWFAISGILGLVIGDSFLFQAFVLVGPRLSMLMFALVPAFAALSARILLGETLSASQSLGIVITMAGIALVILDHNSKVSHDPNRIKTNRRNLLLGLLFGFGGAVGQALGLVTAKPGLADGFPAISGTLIRMFTAAMILWGFALLRRQAGATITELKEQPRALLFIFAGAIAGPFLAVTLNLFAIQNTEIGVASTLSALTPVVLLPVGYYLFNERFSWRAILGTVIAITGVALLFLL